ncbi:response regulator [Sediminibacterium sp.]|uniref:response regulator n=1 Tax=Sediminibacterium sp. TaxID=1917865 RepID=UPI003F69AE55
MKNSSINVLIVEDAAIIVQQLNHLLVDQESRIVLHFAETAEQGLKMAERDFPDVFILDIQLPGLSGIELLNQIKLSFPARQPLVIFLTNMPNATYRQACLKNGAHFFLDKSRDFLMLPDIIHQYISNDNFLQSISPLPNKSLCSTTS